MDALRHAQFSSPLDFAIFHLNHLPSKDRADFYYNGTTSHFTALFSHLVNLPECDPKLLAYTTDICELVYPFVGHKIANEAAILRPFLDKPPKSFTPEDIAEFSLQKWSLSYNKNAPFTYRLLSDLALMESTTESTLSQPPASNTTSGGDYDSKKALMVSMAYSILMFARNRLANSIQAHLAYFLAATKTGKRTMAALNALGICQSYETANNIQSYIADASRERYRRHAGLRPFVLSYDNMNYKARTKYQLLHKSAHQQNDTAGYVYFQPPSPTDEFQLKREDCLDLGQTKHLTFADTIPDADNPKYHREAARVHVYRILIKYFPKIYEAASAKGSRNASKEILSIHKLKLVKTEIYTLPTLPLDEAKITDCIEIIKTFMDELGVEMDALNDRVILFKGDQMTARNITLAQFQRQDSAFIKKSETLDFIEPGFGLFHLKMNLHKVLASTYWGTEDSKAPGSLKKFLTLTRNDRVKKDGKDYRALESFMAHVLESLVLAKLFNTTGQKDWAGFQTFVNRNYNSDWWGYIDQVVSEIYTTEFFETLREAETDDRDILNENANLMLRDFLMVRDFDDAIKEADTGRLEKIIQFWCVQYQGTKHCNYSAELIHLVLCLRKLWKPAMREHWLKTALVNPTGVKGAWMPCDLFGELVIRENKSKIQPSSNALSGDHNRNVHAPQIMSYRDSREAIHRTTGSTDYYQQSSDQDSSTHVKIFAEDMASQRLFRPTKGRLSSDSPDEYDYVPIVDLYQAGLEKLLTGAAITNYKSKSKVNWATGIDYSAYFRGEEDS